MSINCKICTALKQKPAKRGRTPEPTQADHVRYIDLIHAFHNRDCDVDNFELELEIVLLCERFGWDKPYELELEIVLLCERFGWDKPYDAR